MFALLYLQKSGWSIESIASLLWLRQRLTTADEWMVTNDLYRCGFPIDVPSGDGRKSFVVIDEDLTTPCRARLA